MLSKERIKIYFKIGRSTKRFVFFEFIYFVLTYILYICMFPACCFRQRTYVAQSFFNGVLNETWTHLCFKYKWPLVSQTGLYRGRCSSFLECKIKMKLTLLFFCKVLNICHRGSTILNANWMTIVLKSFLRGLKKIILLIVIILIFDLLYCVANWTLAKRLECSPMARETLVQSQVESYQRLKKWYLMPPCLTLSIIRYGSRVKWSNPEKE